MTVSYRVYRFVYHNFTYFTILPPLNCETSGFESKPWKAEDTIVTQKHFCVWHCKMKTLLPRLGCYSCNCASLDILQKLVLGL